MSRVVELLRSRRVPQVAALALMSFAFAGCSADTSSRFQASNFSNPFASAPQTEATASVPTATVERRELPQYARPQTAAAVAAPQSYPATPSPVRGRAGAFVLPPPQQPQLEITGSVAPKSVAATRNRPAHGGPTSIIVGTSDTLELIAKRYNVSSAEILRANGYKGPRALSPGQQLIIPRGRARLRRPLPRPRWRQHPRCRRP